jgi:hypothetical protein
VKTGGKQKYVPPKRRLALNGLNTVISQKAVFFITTAVRTSNPTNDYEILQHEGYMLFVVFKYT